MPVSVVFDCNVYFQALISPAGPAGSCLQAAGGKQLALFLTERILAELRDVCTRPVIAAKFGITAARLQTYERLLKNRATIIDDVPHVFTYPRDPKDEHYVDLAIAVGARLVESRDRDLLALADANHPAGRDFQTRFPAISVVTPTELLAKLSLP
jgi:putative PIN family toxin of toxin-antitoxin system